MSVLACSSSYPVCALGLAAIASTKPARNWKRRL